MSSSMSKKVQVVLPDYLYSVLEDKADKEGRSMSNLCAFLLESSLRTEVDQIKQQLASNN